MTVKEKLQEKLNELESLKEQLIMIEPFLDPNNDSYVYSTENIADLSGTHGTTPSNLSEILEIVVKEINDYVEYIKKLPYAETSVIYRERPDSDLAVVSNERADFHIPLTWSEKAIEISIDSVYGYLAMSEYYGKVRKMRVYSSPSIRKGDISGRDINIEVKLYRINTRLNINSEFRSGTGALDVTFTDDVLNPDDMFIIGIANLEKMHNEIVYYQDLTYFIEYEYFDGTTDKVLYNIANRRIGNMVPDIDDTLTGGMIYWDILLMNTISVDVENSIGDESSLNVSLDGPISGGLFDGNILTLLRNNMFSSDVSQRKLSYRSGCSWLRRICTESYSMYDKNTSNVVSIVFNNLRPIDRVIEEAINAL